MRHLAFFLSIATIPVSASLLSAQATGTFADDQIARATAASDVAAARRNTRALIFDPSASSPLRASGWTFVIAREDKEKNEARIQANLCDLIPACLKNNGWDLTLAGPLDTTTHFSTLADLNGLVGTARVESGYAINIGADRGLTGEVRASFARFQSTFRSTGTLAEETFERDGGSLAAGVGYKTTTSIGTNPLALLFKLAYRVERSFEGQDAQNLCAPASVGPSGTLACGDLVVGEPSKVTKNVISVEQWLALGGVAGIRLKIARDVDAGVTGFDVPIYVLPDGKGGLGGGFRAGYRTDDKRFRFSAFVGALKF